eukprot:40882-Pleurochrysis_carterae.AAC.1
MAACGERRVGVAHGAEQGSCGVDCAQVRGRGALGTSGGALGAGLIAQATQVRHQEPLVGVISAVGSRGVEERHEGRSRERGARAAECAQRD